MTTSTKKDYANVPSVLKFWAGLYRSSPKLYLPGTDIDFGFSLICAIPLSISRLMFRYALYFHGWDRSTDTLFASGCCTGICHSTLLLPGLLSMLLSQKYVPSASLHGTPQWYQDAMNALLGFCTGYMIYDAFIGYIVETWQPGKGPVMSSDEWMFLAHHILVTLYMTSTRWAKAGHISAMVLMYFGEFSNPVMNLQLMLEKALEQECCKNEPWLPTLMMYNEQVFSILYIACRVLAASFVFPHLTYDLLTRGRKNAPLWLIVCWLILCYGVQFGSVPMIYTCIDTLKNGPLMRLVAGAHGEL